MLALDRFVRRECLFSLFLLVPNNSLTQIDELLIIIPSRYLKTCSILIQIRLSDGSLDFGGAF